jgi:hypothetical protein
MKPPLSDAPGDYDQSARRAHRRNRLEQRLVIWQVLLTTQGENFKILGNHDLSTGYQPEPSTVPVGDPQ